MNLGMLFKIAKFLFSNWSILKNLITEIMKLFKGESTKTDVQNCVDGVCSKIEEKAAAKKKRGGWFGRARR